MKVCNCWGCVMERAKKSGDIVEMVVKAYLDKKFPWSIES